MGLRDQVDKWIEERAIVGFCPWREGDALLFGVILSRKGDSIVVDEIDPFGKPDGESTFALKQISYFEIDETYVERLKRLSQFRSTKKDTSQHVRKPSRVQDIVSTACESGEPVSLYLQSETVRHTATLSFVEPDWIEVSCYDDLMRLSDRRIVRAEMIVGIRAGTAKEECEAFLLGYHD